VRPASADDGTERGLIGRWHLVRCVALGGMGEVWLGVDPPTRRFAAIKRLRPEVARQLDVLEMFADELRLARLLHHPGLAETYELGWDVANDVRFLAMEYVSGQSLRAILAALEPSGRRLPVALSAHVALELARVLDYAHERLDETGEPLGLVHRDVSPHNALVSYRGDVKLVDFGIAKATKRLHETAHGVIKGKTSYMSPEQCIGELVDRRSDLFSLGIVLHELLTGRRLFTGPNDVDILHQVVARTVPPPSSINPEVPPELDAIVLELLERRLDRRTPSAARLVARLEAVVARRGERADRGTLTRLLGGLFAEERAEEQRVLAGLEGAEQLRVPDDRQATVLVAATARPLDPGVQLTIEDASGFAPVEPRSLDLALFDDQAATRPPSIVLTPAHPPTPAVRVERSVSLTSDARPNVPTAASLGGPPEPRGARRRLAAPAERRLIGVLAIGAVLVAALAVALVWMARLRP
jgi:tRNA A-37 threonylcarbamoyl transferase component Bud32